MTWRAKQVVLTQRCATRAAMGAAPAAILGRAADCMRTDQTRHNRKSEKAYSRTIRLLPSSALVGDDLHHGGCGQQAFSPLRKSKAYAWRRGRLGGAADMQLRPAPAQPCPSRRARRRGWAGLESGAWGPRSECQQKWVRRLRSDARAGDCRTHLQLRGQLRLGLGVHLHDTDLVAKLLRHLEEECGTM